MLSTRLSLLRLLLISSVFLIKDVSPVSGADVYLNIDRGAPGSKLGVGFASFEGRSGDAEAQTLSRSMRSTIREDFLFTQLFSVSEGGPTPREKVDTLAWSGLGAKVVITGDVKTSG